MLSFQEVLKKKETGAEILLYNLQKMVRIEVEIPRRQMFDLVRNIATLVGHRGVKSVSLLETFVFKVQQDQFSVELKEILKDTTCAWTYKKFLRVKLFDSKEGVNVDTLRDFLQAEKVPFKCVQKEHGLFVLESEVEQASKILEGLHKIGFEQYQSTILSP